MKLARLPAQRVLGICHFPSFRDSMQTTQHIVRLGPSAVELMEHNVLTVGADMPCSAHAGRGRARQAECTVLVEFAGEELEPLEDSLRRLDACMADHGFPDAVVAVVAPGAAAPRLGDA